MHSQSCHDPVQRVRANEHIFDLHGVCWERSRCKDVYYGALPFGVLFFAIRSSKKERSTQIFFLGRLFAREKKSKEANLSMSRSEAEDEVPTVLSMTDNLGKKVDMILNKLQKLDNIEARLDNLHKSIASLEESFAFLEKDLQNLKDKTEKKRKKVDKLEFCEVDISDMQKDLKKVQHEAEELKMQLLYQEHYSRRENLMFLGIQENDVPIDAESETENNNVENTKEVIYNFLQKELSLENAVSRLQFQRIH